MELNFLARNIKNNLILNRFIYNGKSLHKLRLIDLPQGNNILVLSPHFDDEIFGCGGNLRKHVLNGSKVSIVYLTDSSSGIVNIKDQMKMIEIRRKESEKACEILGINDFHYLDEVDGDVSGIKKSTVEKFIKIIEDKKPDLIYLPWYSDNHIDHLKANNLLKICYEKYKFNCNICAYEVWTPLRPNILIDVSKEFSIKEKAIKCFKSQLKNVDYLKSIKGLNSYRSMTLSKGKGFTEAFLYLPIKNYIPLIK